MTTEDNEFDGFMETLGDLNTKDLILSESNKQSDYASSFDADIDDLISNNTSIEFDAEKNDKNKNEIKRTTDSIKSHESNHMSQIASMHNQFMKSIKEITDLKLSEENMNINVEISTPKLSIDCELNQLLEPEQDDTVEISISDDNEDDNQSDSEIILQNIDDLESIASPQIHSKNIDKKQILESNTNNENNKIKNTKNKILSPSNLHSDSDSDSDSDSNTPEYDLISFGIKDPTKSSVNTQITLRSSLPSTSSFENQKTLPKATNIMHQNDDAINIVSNISSITSTPNSKKSILTNEDAAGLTKLKQKIKSDKNSTVIYHTPVSKKHINTFIQTPRHSLKTSVKNSRNNSESCSAVASPNAKYNKLEQQVNRMQNEVNNKENIIKQLEDKIVTYETNVQQINKEYEQQKSRLKEIQKYAHVKIKNAESKAFRIECKLKEYEKKKSIRDVLNSDENNMNCTDSENMRKEITSMDRIIEGLNKENAKLVKQLKEEKIDLRQSQQLMYKENEKLNKDLIQTQHQLSEIQENKIEELQPAAFNEIQRLRKELNAIKETFSFRERELGLEISKLKEENRTLQFKLHGLDKQSFENECDIISQFKKEALRIQKKSQKQIDELQRKLKWYIENQTLITNLNDEIRAKNEQIISLKSSETSSPKNGKNIFLKKNISPRRNEYGEIVFLKKKISDLERLLSSKHPDSIANLITIMGNDGSQNRNENIIIKQLREQIILMNEELDNKEDETLARLRGLRQQYDKVHLQLNNKINSLQKQLRKSKREKGFVGRNSRIKEFEKQIIDLKESHNKKIKLLKDKKQCHTNNKMNNKMNNNKRIIELQNDLQCKSNNIETLNVKLNEKDAIIHDLQMKIDIEKHKYNDLKKQISLLQNTNSKYLNHKSKNINESELNDCKTDVDKDKEIYDIDKEKEKMYIEKIKIMKSEINEYKRQCNVLTDKLELQKVKGEQSIKAMQNQLEWNKLEKEKTEQIITKLQFELNHTKNTPSYVEYESLLVKLEKIEKRNSDREKELEQTYMRLIQTNNDTEEQLTKKYETKIQSLQNELTILMTAFDKIQSSS